ncbi:hypothetical protein C8Q76DRAFT_791277 [Earliella scabrosa]|nr:hypothetical protein C8Q76DRAFT_791277 [Earliella scabrosa]
MSLQPLKKFLPIDVVCVILWQCDILTLLRWRFVSQFLKREVERRAHMLMLIGEFVPDAHFVLSTLSRFNAVISAETALAFFLDDPRLLTKDLEVCVSEDNCEQLIQELRAHFWHVKAPFLKVRPCDVQDKYLNTGMDRIVVLYAIMSNHMRLRYIRFVTSRCPGPLLSVVVQLNTAFMCFFSADILSCPYAALTLRRRAMNRGRDWGLRRRPWELLRNLRLLARGAFVLGQDAGSLIDPPLEPPPPPEYAGAWETWCLGHLFLCGCRIRHFGDDGCLTAIIGDAPTSEVVQRYLVHPGREEGDSHRVVGWRFPDRPPTCLGVHDHSNDEEGHHDAGGFLVEVSYVRFNFEPFFVGDRMLGSRARLWTDWTLLPYNDILRARLCYRWASRDRPVTMDLDRAIERFMTLGG